MKYIRYTVETTNEAEDIVCAVLSEAGIEGLEISDSLPWSRKELDEIFVDEVRAYEEVPEGMAYVSFYLEDDDKRQELLQSAKDALEDLRSLTETDCGSLSLTSDELEDEDYLNSWKQFFHSFEIDFDDGKKMSIVPSWEEDPGEDDSDILLHIDPGTAFGTGAHETTKMCIILLEKYLEDGMSVLDIGTGSGILSMSALKFGASRATGTELDAAALPAVEDNFRKNGLSDSGFRVIMGDVVTSTDARREAGSGYDMVIANILPPVLIPLTDVMAEMVKAGGYVLYSGILTEKAPDVIRALETNRYEILEKRELGEWCAIISKAP